MFTPSEKGTTIRVPSTANLMIDSADRDLVRFPNPFDFQITRNQSILNGFFTRIGTTEIVLEWRVPNGSRLTDLNNGQITVTWATGPATQTVSPFSADKFYTQSEALEVLVTALNTAFSTNVFEVVSVQEGVFLQTTDNSDFTITDSLLTQLLGFLAADVALNVSAHIVTPSDLRPHRYLDFVSAQLTYNQDLKDSSTLSLNRDVLCRFYFTWDTPPTYDPLGFPILMGYTPFTLRRIFNPPKQIRWDNIQPLGNLSFQVYDDNGDLVPEPNYDEANAVANWLLTLQVSEV